HRANRRRPGRGRTCPGAAGRARGRRLGEPYFNHQRGDAPQRPARPGAPDFQSRYLDHLEKENSFLREQNTVLLERVKETNILTGRLQVILTPLLSAPNERDRDAIINPSEGN